MVSKNSLDLEGDNTQVPCEYCGNEGETRTYIQKRNGAQTGTESECICRECKGDRARSYMAAFLGGVSFGVTLLASQALPREVTEHWGLPMVLGSMYLFVFLGELRFFVAVARRAKLSSDVLLCLGSSIVCTVFAPLTVLVAVGSLGSDDRYK